MISGQTSHILKPIWKLWSGIHKRIYERSEVDPVAGFLGEDVWDLEFSIYVYDLYFIVVNALLDVVIMDTDVFYPFCCELFLPVRAGEDFFVAFGWLREVNMGYVLENVPDMLYHIGAFFVARTSASP